MRAIDESAADFHRVANDDVRLKVLDGCGGTDDINDGIHGAHFMKVHLLRWYVMNFALGVGNQPKDGQRSSCDRVG